MSTRYAMLLSAVYDTALPPVKLYVPCMHRNSAQTRVSTAESFSLFGGGQGIGVFFAGRGMSLEAHTLGCLSKSPAPGRAEERTDFCSTSLALSHATKRSGCCRSLERHENFVSLGLLFLVGGVFQLPDLLEGRNESLIIGFL